MKDVRLTKILLALHEVQLVSGLDCEVKVLTHEGNEIVEATLFFYDKNCKKVTCDYPYGNETVSFYSHESTDELTKKVRRLAELTEYAQNWITKEL